MNLIKTKRTVFKAFSQLTLLSGLVATAITAEAKSIGYFFAVIEGNARMHVFLSDAKREASECDFNGKSGQLGQITINGWRGNLLDEYVGCWITEGDNVLFSAKKNSQWRHWSFPKDKFSDPEAK